MITTTFVFLGTISEVHGGVHKIKLTRFGQRVELPADLAEETTHEGGLPCIPATIFDPLLVEFGVDAKMLKKWGPAAAHANAPAEFQAMVKRSRELLHDLREPEREKFRQAKADALAAQTLADQPKQEEEE